jgi:hypothetical protein
MAEIRSRFGFFRIDVFSSNARAEGHVSSTSQAIHSFGDRCCI